jgi:hypothetical protein
MNKETTNITNAPKSQRGKGKRLIRKGRSTRKEKENKLPNTRNPKTTRKGDN